MKISSWVDFHLSNTQAWVRNSTPPLMWYCSSGWGNICLAHHWLEIRPAFVLTSLGPPAVCQAKAKSRWLTHVPSCQKPWATPFPRATPCSLFRADSRLAPSRWKTLQSNTVSLAGRKPALVLFLVLSTWAIFLDIYFMISECFRVKMLTQIFMVNWHWTPWMAKHWIQ